ncbi:MAG: C25 family cysteine peptidase, partial [Bacteroidota bacterium]
SLLYRSAYDQINPDYSLFTNTSVYFLTHNSSTNNPRLVFEQYILDGTPKEEYFMHKSLVDFPDKTYYEGNYYQSGNIELYKSPYDPGEGYIRTGFLNQTPISFTVNTPFVYTQGPNAVLRTYFANHSRVNNQNHRVEIKLNTNFLFIQPTPAQTSGFQLFKDPINVGATQLTSGANTLTFRDLGNSLSFRSNAIGFIEMEYPRQFNFGGADKFYFKLAPASNRQYLEITGFNSSGTQPLLYDFTNGKIYRSIDPAGTAVLRFLILSSGTARDMYLRSDNANSYTQITQISSGISFPSYQPSDYYIISHSNLRNDGTGNDPVEEFRVYRSSKYPNAQVVDIDILYDQFGYGIKKSPLAIRNFISYAKNTFDLKYVFVIGKGRENFKIRDGGSSYNQCLVPTFGYPGSDNLLASTRASDLAQVAVGRLAAENRAQVRNYLDKIKKYEQEQNISLYASAQAIEPKIWQKELLHFSGGTTRGEQTSFKGFVDSYGRIAKDTLWGATTTTYSKTSSAPIDQSLAQIIKNRINEGVSWITFFGHSSTGAFDFSIDEPQNYNNSPKFPIILSNGCFSGFIHDVTQGFSERFVFAPDKAAIAFMATSSLSLPVGLHKFSTEMYNNVCVKNYFQPLGKSFQQTYNDVICCSVDNTSLGVAYEMTLHGDPGLIPNQYPKPDYAIESSSVYFNPATVTAGTDSFDVNIIITNLGRAIDTSITVSLKREVTDISNPGIIVPPFTYLKVIRAPYYKDTVSFKLPVTISNLGYGQNTFYPYVDAGFDIDEMAEQNNGLTIPVTTYIQNDDIIPIYPYEFAIVPQKGVTLKASTINPFAPLRSYRIQIDTSELFTMPLGDTVINQIGGVVRWATNAALYQKDSTVFYWRVRRDSDSAEWHYTSFIYLQGEYPGWNQSHLFQWQKDNYLYMSLDSADRVFKFPSTVHNIRVNTGFGDAMGGNLSTMELGWYLNNSNMHLLRFGRCNGVDRYFYGGLTFAVINNLTGLPWASINANGDDFGDLYGNVHCPGYGPQYGFDFAIDANHRFTIPNFINAIPAGFYVLIYSVNDPISGTANWHPDLVQALQALGFDQAPDFEAGTLNGPFTFFTQKGNTTYPKFFANKPAKPAPNYAKLDTSFNFTGNWNSGQFTSPKIGPAVEWGSVHWVHDPFETPDTDLDTIDIIGVKADGTESVLLTTVNLNNFISNISAVD